jgi:hypothetical protein
VIDRAQQILRQALVLEIARRAMAARQHADQKNSERAPQAGEARSPTVNAAEAWSDAAQGRPTEI